MKTAVLINLVTLLAVARAYIEPSLLSPHIAFNNAIVAATTGTEGLMCFFQVEFSTGGKSLVITDEIKANVTNIVEQVVAGVDACEKPIFADSGCYTVKIHGVVIHGCSGDLGFNCQMNEQVATCATVDTGPVLGITFPTQYGNATFTQATVRDIPLD